MAESADWAARRLAVSTEPKLDPEDYITYGNLDNDEGSIVLV